MKKRGHKPPKPKAVNFELIPVIDLKHIPEPYRILQDVRLKYHSDLNDAKIVLAWRKSLKPDRDGHLVLGKCVKVSDLHKELKHFDFVILLNKEVWNDAEFTAEKKRALIDHELCHATRVESQDGEPKLDERGRPVFRLVKHDIEEFRAVVARHGCYKRDLELFAEALLKKRMTDPLLPLGDEPPDGKAATAGAGE